MAKSSKQLHHGRFTMTASNFFRKPQTSKENHHTHPPKSRRGKRTILHKNLLFDSISPHLCPESKRPTSKNSHNTSTQPSKYFSIPPFYLCSGNSGMILHLSLPVPNKAHHTNSFGPFLHSQRKSNKGPPCTITVSFAIKPVDPNTDARVLGHFLG